MAEFAVMKTALPLVGIMALWLGIMRLAERAGLVAALARALRPLMVWLFPDVPPDHPAMGSMLLNMAASILGLGNAVHSAGPACHERPGVAQPPARHGHERHVHLPGHQYQFRPAHPGHRHRHPGRQPLQQPHGHRRHLHHGHHLRGDCGRALPPNSFQRLPIYRLPPVAAPLPNVAAQGGGIGSPTSLP